jgi:tRNA pseudouridine13 synthase
MYKIKQLPEDFIVKEISNVITQINGQYAYFILKKTNYTTIDALQVLSEKFKIPLKNFGFAGNKDKDATTEQKISIFMGSKNFEDFKFNNVELKYLGNGKEPISLGDLDGNEFTITIRNLSNEDAEKIKNLENKKLEIPNLYGPQRFSKNNDLVGRAIIKKDFGEAVDFILENNGVIEDKIKHYLKNNKNDYIGALRIIPLKTRKLFVHSYQSFLFNKIASEYLEYKPKNAKIPVIGFDFELKIIKKAQLRNIFKKIIDEEKINPRDFIISQMPELSSEGGFRDLFFELKDLKILEISDDELNKDKRKIKISFSLPKSCYATVALESFFQQP